MTRCCFCLRQLAPSQAQYAEVTHCWAPVRKAGGANALKHPTYSGRTACDLCLSSPTTEQPALFDN